MADRFSAAATLFLVLLGATYGCGGSDAPDGHREAYDVPPLLEVPTEDDQQEVRRPPELSGMLPADFPGDFPLYLPASLIDYGQREDGRPWIEMLSPHQRQQVKSDLSRQIAAAGWLAESEGGSTWRQGGRIVHLEIRDGQPGTLIRVVY